MIQFSWIGIGYLGKHLFFDFAYVVGVSYSDLQLYELKVGNSPVAAIKNTTGNAIASFGIKF